MPNLLDLLHHYLVHYLFYASLPRVNQIQRCYEAFLSCGVVFGRPYERLQKNILIIKMSSLGDVIWRIAYLVHAVRKNWPPTHITWAIHEQFESLPPGKPWVELT